MSNVERLVKELEQLLPLGRIPSPPWICFYANGLEYILEEAKKLRKEELEEFSKRVRRLGGVPYEFIYEIESELEYRSTSS